MNYQQCKYRKQFVAGERSWASQVLPADCRTWTAYDIAHLRVFCEPALSVSQSVVDDRELTVLGTIIDPENESAMNQSIAADLAQVCEDFDTLEQVLARMAGRWVVLARISNCIFLYHDACGLKTVFRGIDPRTGNGLVAS